MKTPAIGHPGIDVWNSCEHENSSENRLLENTRVKKILFVIDRRLKPNGPPPFLNSSGSSLANYTCTLVAVQPYLRNKLADDTWILQDWQPSWKERTRSGVARHYGKSSGEKRKIIGHWLWSNFYFSSVSIFFIYQSLLTGLVFSNLSLNYFYNPLFKHFWKYFKIMHDAFWVGHVTTECSFPAK